MLINVHVVLIKRRNKQKKSNKNKPSEMTIFIAEYQCPANYAKCDDNLACILEIYFCDEFHDCKDKSDESAETCATTPTPAPSEGEYLLLVYIRPIYLCV